MSSFVAVAALLAVSASIAIYVYMSSVDMQALYSPGNAYGYGYLVCYNITGRTISLGSGVQICNNLTTGNPKYLCVARVTTRVGVSMVFDSSVTRVDVDSGCVLLLYEVPVHAYADDRSGVVIEVKLYDPWTR